jgi:putative toxin-antitoxin system antitoxin component (TIGR02293 family)
MSRIEQRGAAAETIGLQRVAALLGGVRVLRHEVSDPLAAHDMIMRGLPARALTHLMDELVVMQPTTSLEKAIGMSLRTFQRRKAGKPKPLSQEQGSRTWKFAEILAKATGVFGTQEAAEQWLERPAIGLNRKRPIDLLASSAGVEMVEQYLGRLDYDVYT